MSNNKFQSTEMFLSEHENFTARFWISQFSEDVLEIYFVGFSHLHEIIFNWKMP